MKRFITLAAMLALICLALPAHHANAQTCRPLTLSGTVLGTLGNPVGGVTVNLAIGYEQAYGQYTWYTYSVESESDGTYELKLSPTGEPDIGMAWVTGDSASAEPISCSIDFEDLQLGSCRGCPPPVLN